MKTRNENSEEVRQQNLLYLTEVSAIVYVSIIEWIGIPNILVINIDISTNGTNISFQNTNQVDTFAIVSWPFYVQLFVVRGLIF